MKFCEEHHIVNGWTHIDVNGGVKTSDVVSLANFDHVAIVLDFGNTAALGDSDITILACDDAAATHSVAINNFTVRKSPGTTSDDVFAAAATMTDSKIDYVAAGDIIPNTGDDSIVVIDIDASKAAGTSYDYAYVQVSMTDPGQVTPVGCKFILSKPRHAAAVMPSAIV